MRRRDYPGWRIVWALAVTETVSYGVLYYAFAVFLPAMQQHLADSQTALAGAFSLSVLVTGAGAIPAGVWLDRHGARGLMTAGSVLAAGSCCCGRMWTASLRCISPSPGWAWRVRRCCMSPRTPPSMPTSTPGGKMLCLLSP